ncbi:uncharacterized protein ColSpa_06386 [Colletotrichum spaethianum]|uniref:Uncharacterized protein n=1 Tax=Colletotrichum spaethianum TaxID=700344 RepID=A0AA37P111_9PEZI|nr:uncharacterized protein ColSpa_06386 [Colletotrichum spaethianum]GKT46205.1 hypothetical protein ColSpa_06386 [Colletotrichum spaethianum]
MFHEVQRSINYHIRQESCDRSYKSNENGNGMIVVLTLPKPIPKFGEWRLNVEQVIRDNMCKRGPSSTTGSTNAYIYATSLPVESSTINIGYRAENTPTIVNQDVATLASGRDNNSIEGLESFGSCPPALGEDHTCDNVNKSPIESVDVGCSYVSYQGKSGKFLDYKIAISPTGQGSRCWCDQLLAAVRARCSKEELNQGYSLINCNSKHIRSKLGYGVYINLRNNAWDVGVDSRGCIEEAIEYTTCGIPTQFDRGGRFEDNEKDGYWYEQRVTSSW